MNIFFICFDCFFFVISKGDAMRRFEPTVNVNNTNGYKRLSIGHDESDFEGNTNNIRLNDSNNDSTYYTDVGPEFAGPVEQLYKILLEYAGVELSVASSIEPLFEKLGQTVFASAQIKRFDVKILPNEPTTNESQLLTNHPPVSPSLVQFRVPHNRLLILNTSNELTILSVTNLSIQSVCRQSLVHDQLHSGNVQAGIRVQRVKQEVNLSFIRLVYQFYTVVGNALEYTGIDEITKTDTNPIELISNPIEINPENGIQGLVFKSLEPNLLHYDDDDLDNPERQCWKKLRELVAIYGTLPEIKQVQPPIITRKQQRSGSQPPNENLPQQNTNTSFKYLQNQTRNQTINLTNETLLLSSFGWLIIDEIHYAASLSGLKVEGCMRKAQGSISLSQRLRALHPTTNHQNTKKYETKYLSSVTYCTLTLRDDATSPARDEPVSHARYDVSSNFGISRSMLSVLENKRILPKSTGKLRKSLKHGNSIPGGMSPDFSGNFRPFPTGMEQEVS
jgi:hypothetical protein